MSLDIVVQTTEAGLAVLATLKAELGITTTSADDRLTRLIGAASAWAESYVGYPLLARKYRETLAAYGGRNLMVSRTPVRAVTALFLGTDTGDDGTEQLLSSEFGVEDGPGFLTRTEGWEWTVPTLQDFDLRPSPGNEYRPWLADYVAGFTLDGISTGSSLWSTEKGTTSTGRTLPYDIEEAVMRKATETYRGMEGVSSKRVGDLAISFGSGATGQVLDTAASLLGPYRRSA